MKKTYKYLIISLFATFFSCEKVIFDKTNLDKPVVDGIIYANQNPVIHLSLPIGYGVDTPTQVNIDNAKVSLIIEGKTYDLVSKGNGEYTSTAIKPKAGQSIDLKILFNNYTVTANTIVPTKPKTFKVSETQIQVVANQGGGPMGGGGPNGGVQVAATWDNDIQEYYAIMAKNIETNPEPIPNMGRGGQQQQFTPALEQIANPTQSNTTNINRRNFGYYGKYKLILFKVNPEYVDLYNNRGQSSLNLTNPPTNITNGFGVFTAMNADTTSFLVTQ